MKTPLRTKIRAAIRSVTGYDLHKAVAIREPFSDIQRLIAFKNPVLFDVGANTGQTIEKLIFHLPSSQIHAFEPSKIVFRELERKWQNCANVHLNNVAVGAESGRKQFFENSHSLMNSFLPLGPEGWGNIVSMPEVELTTIDRYCRERGITRIDLLKSDTQGFDLEVLKGAQSMLRNTHLVYMEMNFAKVYENMASFDEMYRMMIDNNFAIVRYVRF